jgi:hypothetical protein
VYIRAPQLDRYAVTANVRTAVQTAAKSGARIELNEPVDFNRFPIEAQRAAWAWLGKQR